MFSIHFMDFFLCFYAYWWFVLNDWQFGSVIMPWVVNGSVTSLTLSPAILTVTASKNATMQFQLDYDFQCQVTQLGNVFNLGNRRKSKVVEGAWRRRTIDLGCLSQIRFRRTLCNSSTPNITQARQHLARILPQMSLEFLSHHYFRSLFCTRKVHLFL